MLQLTRYSAGWPFHPEEVRAGERHQRADRRRRSGESAGVRAFRLPPQSNALTPLARREHYQQHAQPGTFGTALGEPSFRLVSRNGCHERDGACPFCPSRRRLVCPSTTYVRVGVPRRLMRSLEGHVQQLQFFMVLCYSARSPFASPAKSADAFRPTVSAPARPHSISFRQGGSGRPLSAPAW